MHCDSLILPLKHLLVKLCLLAIKINIMGKKNNIFILYSLFHPFIVKMLLYDYFNTYGINVNLGPMYIDCKYFATIVRT